MRTCFNSFAGSICPAHMSAMRVSPRSAALSTLRELDLRGTFVSDRAVPALAAIKSLRRIRVANTFINWWGRVRLGRLRTDLEICNACEATHHAAGARRAYRTALGFLVAYWLLLFFATHVPMRTTALPALARELLSWDKAGHAVLYGALAVLAATVVALRSPDRYLICGLSLLACVWIVIGVSVLRRLRRNHSAAHQSHSRLERLGCRHGGRRSRGRALCTGSFMAAPLNAGGGAGTSCS